MNVEAESPVETIMRDELAHGDAVLGSLAPILGHLVATEANVLFNDQVVATIRGRAMDVAGQLLREQASAAGEEDVEAFVAAGAESLAADLLGEQDFLLHCHALTIEAQTARHLQKRSGIDPVVSPMLQSLIASKDAGIAGGAMAILASQARFFQQHERMELPVRELPGSIFDVVLMRWRSFAGPGTETVTAQAEMTLRSTFDEGAGRIGLLSRMVHALGRDARAALSVGHGGLSLFASTLASATEQSRDIALLATTEQQLGRLALSLRAAGFDHREVEEQFQYLHPDVALPEGFETLRIDRAAAMLVAGGDYPEAN
ncbi:MAG: hypothetical protein R3D99_10785 [Altererythrobacter sp.]